MRSGTERYGAARSGTERYGAACSGTERCGVVRSGTELTQPIDYRTTGLLRFRWMAGQAKAVHRQPHYWLLPFVAGMNVIYRGVRTTTVLLRTTLLVYPGVYIFIYFFLYIYIYIYILYIYVSGWVPPLPIGNGEGIRGRGPEAGLPSMPGG